MSAQENRPAKIISGGQTGVDRAALDVALSLGIPAGGWCPQGRRAEDGVIPARYPLQALAGGGYSERTARNVAESDGTVIFHGGVLRGGTGATAGLARDQGKPLLIIDASRTSAEAAAEELRDFARREKIMTLNVAGPRASEWAEGCQFAGSALTNFLSTPALSFVVPAHNEELELPECLRSIAQAAAIAGQAYEVIVVDDASTDATAAIARELGARVVTINRRQIAAARNAGARLARGQFLFFVDADTRISPGHVSTAVHLLGEGFSGGSARVVADRRLPFWGQLFLQVFSTLYFATGLGAGAFLFTRREFFEKAGGFDEQYFAGEEVYLSLALKKLGRFKILREPIVTSARKLRMHPPRFVCTQLFHLALGGKGALRSRDRLALWYDGKREEVSTR